MAHADEQHDKISVQCQDDTYGFNAQVVYEDRSFPLRRCTPFLTIYRRHDENNTPRGDLLLQESQESSLYGNPVIHGDTVDDQDVATDSTVRSLSAQKAGRDQLISIHR